MIIPADKIPAVVNREALGAACKAAGADLETRGPTRLEDGSLDPAVVYTIDGVTDAEALRLMAEHDGQPLPPYPVPVVILEDADGSFAIKDKDGKSHKVKIV